MAPSQQQRDDWNWSAFEGWSLQRYTQIPNLYLRQIMHRLSPTENMVILYIFYKTFGWQKERDAISISQIVSGTVNKKTGEVFDHGTGLARSTVITALKSLVEKRLISVYKRTTDDGVNEINVYEPRFRQDELDAEGVVRNSDYGCMNVGQGVVRNSDHGSPNTVLGVVRNSDPHEEHITQEQEQQQQPVPSTPPPVGIAPPGVVVASPGRRKGPTVRTGDPQLLGDLMSLGVSGHVARQLVAQHEADAIREQLAALAFRTNVKDPGAVLVQSIRESWAMPRSFLDARTRSEQAGMDPDAREAAAAARRAAEEARRDRQVRIDAHLAVLPSGGLEELTEAATRRLRESTGSFWTNRPVPKVLLDATVRLIVAERMGLGPEPGP